MLLQMLVSIFSVLKSVFIFYLIFQTFSRKTLEFALKLIAVGFAFLMVNEVVLIECLAFHKVDQTTNLRICRLPALPYELRPLH